MSGGQSNDSEEVFKCYSCKKVGTREMFKYQAPLLLGFGVWVCKYCGAAHREKDIMVEKNMEKEQEVKLLKSRIEWGERRLSNKLAGLGEKDLIKITKWVQFARKRLEELEEGRDG